MTPPSAPQPHRSELPDAGAKNGDLIHGGLNGRHLSAEPSERSSAYGIPIRELGATGVLNCEFWDTDFREGLDAKDPLRKGFKKSPADGSRESVTRLAKLHNVALRATTIDR